MKYGHYLKHGSKFQRGYSLILCPERRNFRKRKTKKKNGGCGKWLTATNNGEQGSMESLGNHGLFLLGFLHIRHIH